MKTVVEVKEGLERQITVTVPAERINADIDKKCQELAKKANIPGFRRNQPVPISIIKQRYLAGVTQEVTEQVMRDTLEEAIEQEKLKFAGVLSIDPSPKKENGDLEYRVLIEILPEFDFHDLHDKALKIFECTDVSKDDINSMLEKIRRQHITEWLPSKQTASEGDQVNFECDGWVGEEKIEACSLKDQELIVGDEKMPKAFEDSLVGAKKGDAREVDVDYPSDYPYDKLAGNTVHFKINVIEVLAPELPTLDDDFAGKLGIEGGMDAVRSELKDTLEKQARRMVTEKNKQAVWDTLLGLNEIEVPNVLIGQEMSGALKKMSEQEQEYFKGNEHLQKKLREDAVRRVHLTLLIKHFIEENNIEVGPPELEKVLDRVAADYQDPHAAREWYLKDKERMSTIRTLAIEECVFEDLLGQVTQNKEIMSYADIIKG